MAGEDAIIEGEQLFVVDTRYKGAQLNSIRRQCSRHVPHVPMEMQKPARWPEPELCGNARARRVVVVCPKVEAQCFLFARVIDGAREQHPPDAAPPEARVYDKLAGGATFFAIAVGDRMCVSRELRIRKREHCDTEILAALHAQELVLT